MAQIIQELNIVDNNTVYDNVKDNKINKKTEEIIKDEFEEKINNDKSKDESEKIKLGISKTINQ